MFSDNNPLQDSRKNLDRPFSMDKHGNIVIMREYIAVYGHEKVRVAIGNPVGDHDRGIKTSREMSDEDLFKLAEACELNSSDDVVCGSISGPSYTKEQRLESFKQRGRYAWESVSRYERHMQMMELAIQRGCIEFIDVPDELEFPPLT